MSLLDAFYLHIKSELIFKQNNPRHPLPVYVKISPKPISSPEWNLFHQKFNGKFVYVNTTPVHRKVKKLAICLFLWEAALVLSLSFIFYKLLWQHLKEREENRQFLEMLLLAISHKLGNFLAAQRVNIEILKETQSPKAVERLERGYNLMEKEFKHILRIIKNFKGQLRQRQKIDLTALINEIISGFKEELEGKSLDVSLSSVQIYGVKTEIEMIFYILIENAIKYADRKILIHLIIKDNKVLFVIKNDINPQVSKGSGIGLKLSERLAQANKIKLTFREENGYFIGEAEIKNKIGNAFSQQG